jgi:protein tyrosine/serine phosphatase
LLDYFHLAVRDHGLVRVLYANRHKVADVVWRAGQPWPHDIRRYKRNGIRTIVNLRGEQNRDCYRLERAACEKYGVRLVDIGIKGKKPLSGKSIEQLVVLLKTIEYPAVIQCKSGRDRVGFAAALFLNLEQGLPLAEALGQLNLRYGHLKSRKAGILDHFFRVYQVQTENAPVSPLEWVRKDYDPAALAKSFEAVTLGDVIRHYYLKRP